MRRIIGVAVVAVLSVGGMVVPATSAPGEVNVNFASLNFNYAAARNIASSTVALSARCTTSSTTNCVGKNAGDVVLFPGVVTVGGQTVDAVITTTSVGTNTNIRYYEVRDNAQWIANPEYFWVNNGFPSGKSSYSRFNIAFYAGGSYTGVGTGTSLTLRNVQMTAIELDNTQYAKFTGADSFTLATPSKLSAVPTAGNWMEFLSQPGNTASNEAAEHRVVLNYNAVQKFDVEFGKSGGSATNATYALVFNSVGFDDYETETTLIDDPDDSTPEIIEPEDLNLEPGTEIVEVSNPDCDAKVVNGAIVFTPSSNCSGREELELVVREPDGSTKDVDVELQVGLKQEPTKPLNLPDEIPLNGTVVIVDHKVKTNAGQTAKVRVSCQPLLRGDANPCVVSRSGGVITLTTNGTRSDVTVKLTAPADGEYGKYKKVKRYTMQ